MATRIDKMIAWALDIVKAKYQYSQNANLRWGVNPDSNGVYYFDCAAYCLTALNKIAGVDFSTGSQTASITYTGNMYKLKNVDGLIYIPYDKSKLERGDIIYYHKSGNIGHVAMYIGNGQMCEARGKDYGVVLSPFRNSGWQYIVRIKDNYVVEEDKQEIDMDLKKFPELKKGDKNVYVGLAQVILRRYIDPNLEIDNSFGSKTANAVMQFYKNCGVSSSTMISKQFWDLAERSLKLWD